MSAMKTLRRVARGERPAHGLLHTARLSALGTEFYGEEAIVACFRGAPMALPDAAVSIEAPGHVLLADGAQAIFADLAEGGIARLWRLGEGAPTVPERAVAVAFDPDLSQARGDVLMAASDHPALAADAVDRVVAAGQALVADARPGPTLRVRAFVVRAFGTAGEGAALFAVYRIAGPGPHTAGFSSAVAWWTPAGSGCVRDHAGEAAIAMRAWTPRIPE